MPIYEYLCEDCGDFSEYQTLAFYDRPQPCPDCARPSPRVVLTAPAISLCSTSTRTAHRRNEQSVEAPKRGRANPHAHGGAGHAHPHPARAGKVAGGRPWMLSH